MFCVLSNQCFIRRPRLFFQLGVPCRVVFEMVLCLCVVLCCVVLCCVVLCCVVLCCVVSGDVAKSGGLSSFHR